MAPSRKPSSAPNAPSVASGRRPTVIPPPPKFVKNLPLKNASITQAQAGCKSSKYDIANLDDLEGFETSQQASKKPYNSENLRLGPLVGAGESAWLNNGIANWTCPVPSCSYSIHFAYDKTSMDAHTKARLRLCSKKGGHIKMHRYHNDQFNFGNVKIVCGKARTGIPPEEMAWQCPACPAGLSHSDINIAGKNTIVNRKREHRRTAHPGRTQRQWMEKVWRKCILDPNTWRSMRRGQIAASVGRTIRYIKGLRSAGHDCLAIKLVGRTSNFGEKSIKKEADGGKRIEMPSAVICKRCASIYRVPTHFRMEQSIDEAPRCKLSLETQRRRRPKRKRTIKRLMKLRDSIKPSDILDFTKKQVVDISNATIKTMKEVGQGTVHEPDEQSMASS